MNRGPRPRGTDNLPSLANAPWLMAPATQTVLRVIEDGGYGARVVGGAVRNTVLRRPVHDIDIATEASPAEVTRLAGSAGLRVVETGISHGTVTVIADQQPFEVTTLREDVATDGRRAEVRFTGDWTGDAQRRDFTMNALYCDADGRLFDPLGGYDDLNSGIVRFIGDAGERIREDYLRILRFFRFYAEYGTKEIDRAGLDACVRERAGIRKLSGERLRQELIKLLRAPQALISLQVMFEYGLLGEFLASAPRLNQAARLCGIDDGQNPILRLAVVSVSVEEDVERIANRLRLANAEIETLGCVAPALRMHSAPDDAAARKWLYSCGEKQFRCQVLVAWSRSFAQLGSADWSRVYSLPERWTAPTFPMTGKLALELGARPGPQLGQALRDVEAMWIESDFSLDHATLRDALAKKVVSGAD